jgi:hypothetical protein
MKEGPLWLLAHPKQHLAFAIDQKVAIKRDNYKNDLCNYRKKLNHWV